VDLRNSSCGLVARTLLVLLATAALAGGGVVFSAAYPDPERFAGDVAAFEAADAVAPPPADATLCIGSSSMRMWHPTIARDLAPLTVIPRGFGGSTMNDVLHFAPRLVLPYRPAAILLYEGDNDIDFGVTPGEFMAAFRAFVALVDKNLPGTGIFVISIKPSGSRWAKWPAMRTANEMLQADCAANARLTYIDVATLLLGDDGLPREALFLPDRLHLNAAGYEVWSQAVAAVLLGGSRDDSTVAR
jgi:lysophospholipase L1-like esterase